MHSPAYGDRQEGVVCKNQTMVSRLLEGELSMSDADKSRSPLYLKIVNDDFKESMKTHEKVIDPERENAKAEAEVMKLQNQEITDKTLKLKELEIKEALINKWDGKYPTTMLGDSSNVLFGIGN